MGDVAERYNYKVSVHRNNTFTLFLNGIIYKVAESRIKRYGLNRCERIGSSDIKQVYSKRIIDIMASGVDIDINIVTSLLLKEFSRAKKIDLGSEMPDRKMIRVYSVFRSIPIMHIHIVEWDYWCNSRERIFHRILQSDLSVALKYSSFKKKLIDKGVSDPKEYGELKDVFIRQLEQKAEKVNEKEIVS